ncbi:MAG: DUF4124 domain-containing protein [Thermodesulfobacteriota bacterium]
MTSMIKMMVIVMVTLFWLFFISNPSFAQVFKWVDEKGTVNFTDDPNKIPAKYKTKFNTLDINPRESPSPTLSVRPETKPHPNTSEPVQIREKMIKPAKAFSTPSTPSQTEVETISKPSPGYIPHEKFIHLTKGMAEAEVLSRFGEPTRIVNDEARVSGGVVSGVVSPGGSVTGTVSGGSIEVIKRYYYIGDKNKGEKTTIIHFRRGKVVNYERI